MDRTAFVRTAFLLAAMLMPLPALAAGALLPGASSKDPYTVDATKLDFFDKDQKLIYTGEVIATQGPTRVRGSVMTIYLDKDTGSGANSSNSVRRIELKGPVTLVQKDKTGTGDTGIYDRVENKWYLVGNVTLTQGTDVTRGDKLVYDLNTSQAFVDGGRQGRVQSVFTPKDSTKDSAKDPTKPADAPKPRVSAEKTTPKRGEPLSIRP